MTKLYSDILSNLQDELVKIQESYSSPKAQDYAEYVERVGREWGLKTAVELVQAAYKKWVNDGGEDLD